MELVARHNISFGGRGNRKTIKAGERFDTEDLEDHISEDELKAMAQNGNIHPPAESNFVTPATMKAQQRAAATAPVTEGRSPRTDVGTLRTAETVGGITRPTATVDEDDDDEDDDAPRQKRRKRKAKPASDDDDED